MGSCSHIDWWMQKQGGAIPLAACPTFLSEMQLRYCITQLDHLCQHWDGIGSCREGRLFYLLGTGQLLKS